MPFSVSVIAGDFVMIKKKETYKHINKIYGRLSWNQITKMHFIELLISFGKFWKCDWKNITQKKKIKLINVKDISIPFLSLGLINEIIVL